jgi:hypothetical protein
MERNTFTKILATACLLVAFAAHADEPDWHLGAHLISVHVQRSDEKLRTFTPGLYAVHRSGFTLGAYSNSEGGASAYGGYTVRRGPLELTAGLVTGYRGHAVLPLLAPGVRLAAGFRLSFIVGTEPSIHLSKEF